MPISVPNSETARYGAETAAASRQKRATAVDDARNAPARFQAPERDPPARRRDAPSDPAFRPSQARPKPARDAGPPEAAGQTTSADQSKAPAQNETPQGDSTPRAPEVRARPPASAGSVAAIEIDPETWGDLASSGVPTFPAAVIVGPARDEAPAPERTAQPGPDENVVEPAAEGFRDATGPEPLPGAAPTATALEIAPTSTALAAHAPAPLPESGEPAPATVATSGAARGATVPVTSPVVSAAARNGGTGDGPESSNQSDESDAPAAPETAGRTVHGGVPGVDGDRAASPSPRGGATHPTPEGALKSFADALNAAEQTISAPSGAGAIGGGAAPSVTAHAGPAPSGVDASATKGHDVAPARAETPPVPLHAVAVEIGLRALKGSREFDIRLDPEELGRVEVKLRIDDRGGVSASLVVDRVETLQLLQREARTLERAFEQAGLRSGPDDLSFSLRQEGGQPGRHGSPHSDQAAPAPRSPLAGVAPTEKPDVILRTLETRRWATGVDISI